MTKSRGERRLLLVFAGWGMDGNVFGSLDPDGYDVAVAWGYEDLPHLPSIAAQTEGYEEICVVAWSYGVAAASIWLAGEGSRLPVTLTMAVNGTRWPVDDRRGIPEAVFKGTLDGLSAESMSRFYRRMCGSREALGRFMTSAPDRTVDSLRRELEAFGRLGEAPEAGWDVVAVSDRDMVIPTANQLEAWRGHDGLEVYHGSHLPDFESLLRGRLVNKDLVERRFGKSRCSYDGAATVQRDVAAVLTRMIVDAGGIDSRRVLEIGCGTGLLTRSLLASGRPSSLTLWDIAPIPPDVARLAGETCTCDAETAMPTVEPSSYDVIASASTLQWFNSPRAFLQAACRALRPGGILAFSTYGPETFKALTQLTGAGLQYPTERRIMSMLPETMEVLAVESGLLTLDFDTPAEMLRHISRSGVNSVKAASPSMALKVLREYPRNSDGRVSLVYQPVWLCLGRRSKN